MDGAASADANERLLVVGATNRPQELDEAARRRLQKRLLIPLPDAAARQTMLLKGLSGLPHLLTSEAVARIVQQAEGYSGSDMAGLCREVQRRYGTPGDARAALGEVSRVIRRGGRATRRALF
jgi:SpoVK/Ycf46/Vps4 family AAA+-type ATPase